MTLRHPRLSLSVAALLLSLPTANAAAQTQSASQYLLGDWHGHRS